MSAVEPATLPAALEQIDRLRKLVEASKMINSSIEDESLFESILMVARHELDVERGTLYFLDRKTKEIWSKIASGLESTEIRLPVGHGLAGTVAETGEPVILHDAYSDPRFDKSNDERSGFHTHSMLCVAIHNRKGVIVGVLQLLNKRNGDFGRRDLDFLEALSDHMAIAMENAMLHRSVLVRDRMERELRLGREIQAKLFPKPPTDIPGLEIAATSVPCYEVGGDYYDFLRLDDGRLAIVIADVSGKGVAAAMIMSSVQAALRMAAPMSSSLTSVAERLNALLYLIAGGKKYVTLFCGIYDPSSGALQYVNAGHNPPVLCADDTSYALLDSTGTPIGLFPTAQFGEASVTLPRGATLILYTDGFPEAENKAEEQFGIDRWAETAVRYAHLAVVEIPAALTEEIRVFEDGAQPLDDKTIVVVRRG